MNEIEESRLVDEARRDVLLYRIISGKLDYRDSYIREPTRLIKEKGLRIYHETLKDCTGVLSDRDIFIFLIDSKQWSFEEQKRLDELPKEIENSKVNYFENYRNPALRRQNKMEISIKRGNYASLYNKRNKYRNLTNVGIAHGAMWFEMINYMYNGSDKLSAIHFYNNNIVSEEDIRDIAQSGEWLSYYSAGKNIFGRAIIKLTEDQRRLLVWSNIYRNCRSNSTCPQDDIFKDHDAFDGWQISERRKEKVETKIQNMKGIDPKANNIYIFGKKKEDFEEIDSLNTPEARRKIENEFKPKQS